MFVNFKCFSTKTDRQTDRHLYSFNQNVFKVILNKQWCSVSALFVESSDRHVFFNNRKLSRPTMAFCTAFERGNYTLAVCEKYVQKWCGNHCNLLDVGR